MLKADFMRRRFSRVLLSASSFCSAPVVSQVLFTARLLRSMVCGFGRVQPCCKLPHAAESLLEFCRSQGINEIYVSISERSEPRKKAS